MAKPMDQHKNVFCEHMRNSTIAEDGRAIGWTVQHYAIRISPGRYPRWVTVIGDLQGMEAAIGGEVEVVFPFSDPVALVVRTEGKRIGLPLNRVLRDDNGSIYDIIAGDFLVVGFRDGKIGSLSLLMLDKYAAVFQWPELFLGSKDGSLIVTQVQHEILEDGEILPY